MPIVSANPEFIALKDDCPHEAASVMYSQGTGRFVGLVDSVDAKLGVTVRFFNDVTKLVSVKDLETTQNLSANYPIGKVVRAAFNKVGRLSLKQAVINSSDQNVAQADKLVQVKTFGQLASNAQKSLGVKIGMTVDATVQLVKDYGLILEINDLEGADSELTGFIVNEQKATGKNYKIGAKLRCMVLDVDPDTKIVDLSERLVKEGAKNETSSSKAGKELQKAVVELSKDNYLVVSLKSQRSRVGVCLLQSLNGENCESLY